MENSKAGRNQVFDLLRLFFATLVLLAHSSEFIDGNRSRELFSRLTHSDMSAGALGVDGFFLLSGFLIVQSWQRDPEFFNFLRKRVLRIVPGYLVAVLLSTLVVGLLAPGVPGFFRGLGRHFLWGICFLSYPQTPPAFAGTHFALVNGALWTISYEFRCYLLVAFLGVLGLLQRTWLWLMLTIMFAAAMVNLPALEKYSWHGFHKNLIFGGLTDECRFVFIFLVGGCFYLFRDRIRFHPALLCVAVLAIVATAVRAPRHFEMSMVIFGSYLLFYIGHASSRWGPARRKFPDISYGVYLYGWPVLGLGIWYLHPPPLLLFAISVPVCFSLGWLSWHYVERPMLTLKRRATAPLPPS